MGVVSCKLHRLQQEFMSWVQWPLTRLNELFIFFFLSSPHHYPFLFLQLVVAIVSIMLLKCMDGTRGKHKR